MVARELIKDIIPPLKTSDTGLKALSWMEEFRVSHLPIVNVSDFLGLISEEDILALSAPEQPIGNHPLSLLRPFVYAEDHLYEVIKMADRLKLSLVPVLDDEQHYMGVATLADLVSGISATGAVQNPGGIVVLELNQNDYSLTEVASIVESEGASLLSTYITSHVDSMKLELTLKINKIDLSRILASLHRHNYNVKASFHQSELTEDLRNRYNEFMNFLNI